MIVKIYKIISETGLHAKPATTLVNSASDYECDIFLVYKNNKIDFKSIIGVLSLGIYLDETITLEFNGKDEEVAANDLTLLLHKLNIAVEV